MSQQDWVEAINAKPFDMELRLVYSDWLEEQGRLDEANGWRWIAKEGLTSRKGYHVITRYTWDRETFPHPDYPKAVLPAEVYDVIANSNLYKVNERQQMIILEPSDLFNSLEIVVAGWICHNKGIDFRPNLKGAHANVQHTNSPQPNG